MLELLQRELPHLLKTHEGGFSAVSLAAEMIVATKGHLATSPVIQRSASAVADAQLFLDIDLSILSRARDVVLEFDQHVRQEFVRYDDRSFAAGRVQLPCPRQNLSFASFRANVRGRCSSQPADARREVEGDCNRVMVCGRRAIQGLCRGRKVCSGTSNFASQGPGMPTSFRTTGMEREGERLFLAGCDIERSFCGDSLGRSTWKAGLPSSRRVRSAPSWAEHLGGIASRTILSEIGDGSRRPRDLDSTASKGPSASLPTHSRRTTADRADVQPPKTRAPLAHPAGAPPVTGNEKSGAFRPDEDEQHGRQLVAPVALGMAGAVLHDDVAR